MGLARTQGGGKRAKRRMHMHTHRYTSAGTELHSNHTGGHSNQQQKRRSSFHTHTSSMAGGTGTCTPSTSAYLLRNRFARSQNCPRWQTQRGHTCLFPMGAAATRVTHISRTPTLSRFHRQNTNSRAYAHALTQKRWNTHTSTLPPSHTHTRTRHRQVVAHTTQTPRTPHTPRTTQIPHNSARTRHAQLNPRSTTSTRGRPRTLIFSSLNSFLRASRK
jgi:hypothetical protein